MGKYIVTKGQSLFDVALHLSGSIEGIVDLLINNEKLSLDTKLKSGDELIYTDDFTINTDIIAYNNNYQIIPANGEKNVYYKSIKSSKLLEIVCHQDATEMHFEISGNGTLDIDWDDNSPVTTIQLSNKLEKVLHYFDNQSYLKRKIKLHGNINIKQLNLEGMILEAIYLLCPLQIEKFNLDKTNISSIDFVQLFFGVYQINITNNTLSKLLPLAYNKNLMSLSLKNSRVSQEMIDKYLIHIVEHYEDRRNCTVTLPIPPSGVYQEPGKNENGNYIIASGFEAMWIITHEPAWNNDSWKFIINDQEYMYEPNN